MSKISPFDLKNISLPIIRNYFSERNIEEVISPLLVNAGGIEPYIDPISVGNKIVLPTSPEISLKKILALKGQNCRGIYEIAHAFRDEITGVNHLREFTMIEWYQRNGNYLDFPLEIGQLLHQLTKNIGKKIEIDDFSKTHKFSVAEIFNLYFNVNPAPEWNYNDYLDLYRSRNLIEADNRSSYTEDPSIAIIEIFSLLFDTAIIALQRDYPGLVFIKDFPPFLGGMAKLSDNGWALRIEGHFNGIEICSGYQEMDDPDHLMAIWDENNGIRKKLGKNIHPIDPYLIELTPQMKDVRGMAMGLERTLMALYKISNIQKFKLDLF